MSASMRRKYTAPSKATSTTLCQKCLKKGHFSYECNAKAQERPYNPRPSRTQQLLNPTLKPKLASDEPNTLLRKEGVADEQLKRLEDERGRKRRRIDGDNGSSRSVSSSSIGSVSTISTNASHSPSPEKPSQSSRRTREAARSLKSRKRSRSGSQQASQIGRSRRQGTTPDENVPRPPRARARDVEESARSRPEVRRRPNYSSSSEYWDSQRSRSRSPDKDERRSRSPVDGRKSGMHEGRKLNSKADPAHRQRSMSPYSKRLALTQAMNMDR